MAYNKTNYYKRVAEVQKIVKREKFKNGLSQKEIFHQFIEPVYHISIRTFYNWLAVPAERELNKNNESENQLKLW